MQTIYLCEPWSSHLKNGGVEIINRVCPVGSLKGLRGGKPVEYLPRKCRRWVDIVIAPNKPGLSQVLARMVSFLLERFGGAAEGSASSLAQLPQYLWPPNLY